MIIDFRFTPPTPKGLPRYTAPPKHLEGYAVAYGTKVYGGSNESIRLMEAPELVEYLDRAQVDKALLKTGDNETTQGSKYPMDQLADYIKGFEDRLIPIAGVDPHKGMDAVRELEWAVKDLGFKGVNLGPYELQIRANDKKFYPIYSKCVELDIPVLLHTSVNFSTKLLLDFGNPIYIDEVAVDFPELKIVCVHGGWPWMDQMVATAWRHKNVFIEISGIRPKYMLKEGSGYAPLLNYGNSILQNQILWGSNWPQVMPEDGIAEIQQFPLKEEVKKKWLGLNAARLLKLDVEEEAASVSNQPASQPGS